MHLLYGRGDAEPAQARRWKLARVYVGDLGHGGVDAVHVVSFHHQDRLCRIKMELEAQINQGGLVGETVCFSRRPYLYVLGQTFQGVNIEALFAGLQAGDDLLGLDAAWADCQTGEAAAEILREPRGHDLSTLYKNGEETAGWVKKIRQN